LLREDVEQSPEFAVLNALGGGPKCVLPFPARFDEIVEYGDHFIVVHRVHLLLKKGAIAVPLGEYAYTTAGKTPSVAVMRQLSTVAGTNTRHAPQGSAVHLQCNSRERGCLRE
jgi:hypothetical protein